MMLYLLCELRDLISQSRSHSLRYFVIFACLFIKSCNSLRSLLAPTKFVLLLENTLTDLPLRKTKPLNDVMKKSVLKSVTLLLKTRPLVKRSAYDDLQYDKIREASLIFAGQQPMKIYWPRFNDGSRGEK